MDECRKWKRVPMGADMSDRGTQIQVALTAWSSMRGVTVVGREKVTNECTC